MARQARCLRGIHYYLGVMHQRSTKLVGVCAQNIQEVWNDPARCGSMTAQSSTGGLLLNVERCCFWTLNSRIHRFFYFYFRCDCFQIRTNFKKRILKYDEVDRHVKALGIVSEKVFQWLAPFPRAAARLEPIMARCEYDPCCASTGAPSPLSGHVGAARCCLS